MTISRAFSFFLALGLVLATVAPGYAENEAEDTATILSNYIDNLNTTVDKKRLDTLMRTLYNEALHV